VPVANNLPTEHRTIGGQDVLWGRGTVDMKAGAAVMLKLAVELAEPKVDVTWIFYDHEEVEAELNGLGRLSRNHPELLNASFAVLCEPSSAEVEGGCNGTMRVEVRAKGVKAHSARPWMGENAIHKIADALSKLSSYQPQQVEVDGLIYRESLNAVLVGGGIATNVIPDEVVLTVNYRYAPSKTHEEVASFLKEFFAPLEVTVMDYADGARPGLDRPEAAAFVQATGSEPDLVLWASQRLTLVQVIRTKLTPMMRMFQSHRLRSANRHFASG
jgi:succinyl-diaminopimelate desuccinylase